MLFRTEKERPQMQNSSFKMGKTKVRWLSNGSKQPMTLHHYSVMDSENPIPVENAQENYQDYV